MTRDDAREVERQLRRRYPADSVHVARVWGGLEVSTGKANEWTFLKVTDDSPLLALLGVDLENDLPLTGDICGDDRRVTGFPRPRRAFMGPGLSFTIWVEVPPARCARNLGRRFDPLNFAARTGLSC